MPPTPEGPHAHNRFDADEYFADLETHAHLQPEKRLLVAVLQRAVLDYLDVNVPRHHRRSARKWLWSGSQDRFSCWWICDTLFPNGDECYRRLLSDLVRRAGKPKIVIMRVDG